MSHPLVRPGRLRRHGTATLGLAVLLTALSPTVAAQAADPADRSAPGPLAAAAPDPDGLVPTRLTTNGRTDPLGLPGAAPSFTWALEGTGRGLVQSAYELRVLTGGEVVWSTGRVTSDDQTDVVYGGDPLTSATRYTWQVRAWDGSGREGAWSEEASFETGLLDAEDWGDAAWIGHETDDPAAAWTDYSADVRFTLTGRAFGTFVRAADTNNAWMMQVSTTNGPRLNPHTRVGGVFTQVESIDLAPYGFTVEDLRDVEHTLTFEVAGDTITTSLDGQVVDTRTDERFGAGFVGFRTHGGEGEAGVVHEIDVTRADGTELLATDFSDGVNPFDAGRLTDAGLVIDGSTEAIVDDPAPLPLLRQEFETDAGKEIASARVYASARGIYQLTLNGEKVGDQQLAPGWTDYATRIQTQTYDVTEQLREGENAVGAALGDGWYRGTVGIGWTEQYGDELALVARVRIAYTDGSVEWVSTDAGWTGADGPFVQGDLQQGETYDAAAEQDGWAEPGFDEAGWAPVVEQESTTDLLTPQPDEPVRETEVLTAVSHAEPTPGVHVYDLGQNMVGVARLTLTGEPGDVVTIRHAEMLNPDGTMYTANLRTAKATDRYVFDEAGTVTYEPTFTQHGFQYVEVMGLDRAPAPADVQGVVWGSDLAEAGTMTTSDDMVNQLLSNISWSQRGNFLSVPTDTPARDERLGWTGDINIFAPTAAYLRDTRGFLGKWMTDVGDAQQPDGDLPAVVPSPGGQFADGGTAWSDAAITVPYSVFHAYDDGAIVRDNWDTMVAFMDYVERGAGDDLIDDARSAFYTGDWLHLDERNTPIEVEGTAYFAENARMMSEMAAAIGEDEAAARYADLSVRVRQAFTEQLVSNSGGVRGDTQTAYALAISMDLITDPAKLAGAGRKLADKIVDTGHLRTGFVGTPELLPALTAAGREDLAFQLLLNETYPSWGYEIAGGATTIWERWNSKNPDGTFGPVDMNSFNHYAYGAVGEWMFQQLGGISATEPGYAASRIAPATDNGRITSADTAVQTVHGELASSWTVEGDTTTVAVDVPVNTTSQVVLRVPEGYAVQEGGTAVASAAGVASASAADGELTVVVGSGSYEFVIAPGTPDPEPEPQPGRYGVGSQVSPQAPWRFARLGAAKPITVYYAGEDGSAVTGTVYVTTRRAGTAQLVATAHRYDGEATRVATPVLPGVKGSYQVGLTFVPDDAAYRTTQRHFWVWATPSGRP